jgi:hypothetical protein
VQTSRGHSLSWGLERHDWYTKCDSEKRCERAAKGMSNDPYCCFGKHQGDVVIKVLKTKERTSTRCGLEERLNLLFRPGKIGFPRSGHLQGSPDYIYSRLGSSRTLLSTTS